MSTAIQIGPRIVEGLYREALVLSDEVRYCFAPAKLDVPGAAGDDPSRIALSAEGLRATTRMTHALAWLLNHRAYFMDEISESHLRRQGRLAAALLACDNGHVTMLPRHVADLVARTVDFYQRLLRLDEAWRFTAPGTSAA